MTFDGIDRNLMMYLQADCKQTNKALALRLNLSVTAVYERIKKLEKAGVIEGYSAQVNKEEVGLGFVVFCHIQLAKHEKDAISYFEREIKKLSEVLECFHVSGEYDYLLKVVVKDMAHFRTFMVNKLTTLDCIGNTQSSFTINEVKNTTIIPL